MGTTIQNINVGAAPDDGTGDVLRDAFTKINANWVGPLTSIAQLTTVANQFIFTTGADTYTTGSITTFGRSLIDDADATAARTTLGLGALAVLGSVDTAQLVDDAVTFVKMQDINADRLLGRTTATAGVVEEIQVGALTDIPTPAGTEAILVETAGGDIQKLDASTLLSLANHTGLLPDEQVVIDTIASPAPNVTTLEELKNVVLSSGVKQGDGLITDGGGGNINVAAADIWIRNGATSTSLLLSATIASSGPFAIPLATTRFIGIEYNAGSPQVVLRTVDDFNGLDEFALGFVTNDNSILSITYAPQQAGNIIAVINDRFHQVNRIERDNITGGFLLSETGTRNLVLTGGALWDRGVRVPSQVPGSTFTDIDTSVAGTFDSFHTADPGPGFTRLTAQTQWNNTQYDDGVGLSTLGSNRWGTHWFYACFDGCMFHVFGRSNTASKVDAENEMEPPLPDVVARHCILAAKVIFQESAATIGAGDIESAFEKAFAGAAVSNHSMLTNLDIPNAGHTASQTEVLLGRFTAAAGAVEEITSTSLTEEPTPAGADFVIGHRSDGKLVRYNIGNLPTGGGGEANTMSSAGTGVDLFNAKSGVDYPMRDLVGLTTGGIDVVLNGSNIEFDLDIANMTNKVTPLATDEVALQATGGGLLNKTTLTNLSKGIDHDQLVNFATNEHFIQSGITVVGTVVTGNVTAVVSAATTSLAGKVELNTLAEVRTATDTTRAVTAQGVDAAKESLRGVNVQTGTTYTMVASDAGKIITFNNVAAIAVTVNDSVFNTGDAFLAIQRGAGAVTFSGTATLDKHAIDSLVTDGLNSQVSFSCLAGGASTIFAVAGKLVPA